MWHLLVIVGQATQPAVPVVVYGPGNAWTPNAVLQLMLAAAGLAMAIFAVVKISGSKASAEAALKLAGALMERSNQHGGQINQILGSLPAILSPPAAPPAAPDPSTAVDDEEAQRRPFVPPPGWPVIPPPAARPRPHPPAPAPAQPLPTAPPPSKPAKGKPY